MTKLGSRRWVAAGFGLIVSLALTAASGPADLSNQPPTKPLALPEPELLISLPTTPVPTVVQSLSMFVCASPESASIDSSPQPPTALTPATGALGAELLSDSAPFSSSAAALSIPAGALIPRTTSRTIWVEVTAYCACKKCCGSNAKGITSSGKPITYNHGRFVAADLKLLPYGTRLVIPGYNYGFPVEVIDRGGAIRGYHVDIFMPTHAQAVEWGKKRLQVQVVE